jgi:hypothetical protein
MSERRVRAGWGLLALAVVSPLVWGQDKEKPPVPQIIVAAPLAIPANTPVKLQLRGLKLDELTEVRIGAGDLKAEITSKGKTPVPQNYEAKRVGDTQAELKVTLPAETPAGKLSLTAVSPAGMSAPYDVLVAPADELIDEKEPNDGFKKGQPIPLGKTVVGTIHEARNVDVFEIRGEAGQQLVATVTAARVGSLLDPVLTLYDARGQVIAGSDDKDARDPRLEVTLKASGVYYLSLQDANDSGGPHFAYLLKVQ